MDFAALMSKEIAKAKPVTPDTPSSSKEKYLKRAELEKAREEAYLSEQQALQAAKEEKASKKRKQEEQVLEQNRMRDEKRARLAEESRRRKEEEDARLERARRKRLGLPELPPQQEEQVREGDQDMNEAELDSELRKLGEPKRLFGETYKQRIRRYKRLCNKPITGFTSLELLPQEGMKVDKVPQDPAGKQHLYRQLASFFAMVLQEWEVALDARPPEVKGSFQGKAATNALLQARENMKPLFRKLENGNLDILDAVVEIVKAAQERRYVDANDAYLRLSIGKA